MPYSYVTYTATAGQTAFGPITFPGGAALRDSHIKAYVNGNLVSATVSGNLSSPTVTLASGASAGNTVKIARETPVTEATRVINFVDGDVLTASDLDEANLNALYASQEARDRADDVNTSVSGAVTSVFGRSGAVTQQTGDYTAAQVTNAVTTDSTQTITGAKTFSAALTGTSGSFSTLTGTSGSFSTTISSGTGVAGTSGDVVLVNGPGATPLLIQTSTAANAIDVRQASSPAVTTFGVTRLGDMTAARNVTVGNNLTNNLLSGTGIRPVNSTATGVLTNSTSDARLKTNVETIVDGMSIVGQLRPVRYTWIDTERLGSQVEVGLIAQEVQAVLPEVIGTNHDGMLSLDYSKVVAVLIGAVKELQARVAALEGGA